MITVRRTIDDYLRSVALSRSQNTARTYTNALDSFARFLNDMHVDPAECPARRANEDWAAGFAEALKALAPATERLYLTAVAGWFEYLVAERLAELNLPRMRMLLRLRTRRAGQRLPQFPRKAIENVLHYVTRLATGSSAQPTQRLRNLRDRAFLLTLADTGLRVHEACKLRRGDLDWNEGHALLVGKGDRQAVVRFSRRSLKALRDYLAVRATLDGRTGRPLSALPLFARHDRGSGRKVLPLSTTSARAVVHQRVREALGTDYEQAITPHSFRHYFVTTVLRGSGGNLKLAQELARHRNISVTQRYAHLSDDELDRGYFEIFDAEAGSE
jgi:site-specific recombinase XerD